MSTPHADDLLGQTIGSYVIVSRVGGGGMGVVYQARDTKLGRTVALKFLPPQWSHDEDARQRFIREAQAASATNHPNICTIHDISTAPDGQLFIVMAYYDGQTLKQRLASGSLTVDEALDIATQIADGLAKAHAQGVVHRDVKPGNVILTEDGARIVDFGLATFSDALKLTVEHSTLGTAAYMSPEQVRGQSADARSDVWAVGIILYEMLTGHVPFQGSHAEAISHAVRHETPAPIRASRPDIGEEIEQLVFRALHKEPSVRYASGRDLARALRQVRGQSVPVDLRTEAVVTPVDVTTAPAPIPPARWKRVVVAAALLALAGGTWWLTRPIDRIPVVVAPVSNQTGDAALTAASLGWTNALISALSDSYTIRVLGHEQLALITRPFRSAGKDVASNDVLHAVSGHSGARVLIVPTLLKEGNGWKARVEFRDAQTATSQGSAETDVVGSALVKETAYGFVVPLATSIEEHFKHASLRAYLGASVRRLFGRLSKAKLPATTLDAATAFEQGLDAYEELEYASALRLFSDAAQRDPLNPVVTAWRSRTARVMRKNVEAEQAARKAMELLSEETPPSDRLFVEAVAAESRGDLTTAGARYGALTALHPDDPVFVLEQSAFQDRRGNNNDAIAAYSQALARDSQLPRAHLDLCRVYNRVPDRARANEHAQIALKMYRSLQAKGGEAQTLLCMIETRRSGGTAEQEEALRYATDAVRIFGELGYPYNLARAYNYLGLALDAQGRAAEAEAAWQRSLEEARKADNLSLQPRILLNLGVMNEALGNRARAADYYHESFTLNETFGEQLSAARNMANAGGLLIEYGIDADRGLSDVRVALGVFEKQQDGHFQVLCRQLIAAYHRFAGRHQMAEEELNRALAVASRNNLDDEIAPVNIDRAQSRLEQGQYLEARGLLMQALSVASGSDSARARIHLGQVHTRSGDFRDAEVVLHEARDDVARRSDTGLLGLLNLSLGSLAYERGLPGEARKAFMQAAALWRDEWPEAASVEATAYVGLLDAQGGDTASAERALLRSLKQAERMQRVVLKARCRLFLARIYVRSRRFDDAARVLEGMTPEANRTIGTELEAQILYWRGQALRGSGDIAQALASEAKAKSLVAEMRALVPEPSRVGFDKRPDIQLIAR